jgi:iron complex outermembrane receptor protein
VTAGVDFRYNLRKEQRNWWQDSPGFVLDDHRTGHVFAFYAQDELKITTQLSLNAGLRVDDYSTFGAAVSPRIAAIFRPDRRTAIKYIFGHAFRVPNAYELYYADSVSQEPNPGLRSETIRSHNLAVERALTPQVRVVGEVFYNQLDRLLDVRVDPLTGMSQYVNLNSVQSKGVEFELEVQRGGWRGDLSYTFQDSHDPQTGAILANLPRHLVKLQAHAPLGPRLLAGIELQYKGPQLTYLDVRIPDSLKANLTVSTRKPLLGFDVSASCYNLLGRRNYDPVAPGLRQNRLPEDGREFRLAISRTLSRR